MFVDVYYSANAEVEIRGRAIAEQVVDDGCGAGEVAIKVEDGGGGVVDGESEEEGFESAQEG